MELKIISWNVNGSKKLHLFPRVLALLFSASVVLLQETFETEDPGFSPPGFIRFANKATATAGRPSKGISSLFLQSKFAGGAFTNLDLGIDWLLITRWVPQGSARGVVFVNVYIPRHSSGFAPPDIGTFFQACDDLLTDFPGDGFLIAGDFNFNRFSRPRAQLDRFVVSRARSLFSFCF